MGSKTTSQVTNNPNPTALGYYDQLVGQANNVAQTPYQSYPGELVAPLNNGQQTAIGQLQGAYGTATPWYNQAAIQASNSLSGLDAIQGYLGAGSQYAGQAGWYTDNANTMLGQATQFGQNSADALGGMHTYMGLVGSGLDNAANTYGTGVGTLGNVGSYLGNAQGSLGAANAFTGAATGSLGNVGNYLGSAQGTLGNVGDFLGAAQGSLGNVGGYLGSAQGSLGNVGSYLGNAQGSLGAANNYWNAASQLGTPQQFSGAAVQQYMSPYTQSVIDSTMANLNQNDAVQQQQLRSNAIGQGAYGGDRAGVAAAELARSQDLANNQTVSGLLNQSYGQALGQYNQEQQNRFQAAGIQGTLGNAQLSAAQGYNALANTGLGQAQGYGQLANIGLGQASGYNALANTGLGAAQGYNALANTGLGQAGQFNALANTSLGQAQGFNSLAGTTISQAGQYGNLGSGQTQNALGQNALVQDQGQIAQQYGNLGSIANQTANAYNALGGTTIARGQLEGSLGQLQGTTAQARAQTAGLLGQLGTAEQQAGVSGASAGLQGSTLQQQIQQQQDQAALQQWQNAISFPYQQTGWLGNIVEGIGSQMGGSQTTQGNALSQVAGVGLSGLGILGATGAFGANGYLTGANGLGSAIGSVFSDERVKEDIQPIGKTFDGQTMYRYRYKGSPTVQTGLIAQDVEKHTPEAVGSLGGIKTLNLGMATEAAAKRGRFSRGGPVTSLADILRRPDQIVVGNPDWHPNPMGGLGWGGNPTFGTPQQPLPPPAAARPHYDLGGALALQNDAWTGAPGGGVNPGLGAISQPRLQSTMPGGSFQGMPRIGSAPPQGTGGLGVLSAPPISGSAGISQPGQAGQSGQPAPQGIDWSGNNQNLWLSVAAAGAGMAAGNSMSPLANLGTGLMQGLGTYTSLRNADREYGYKNAELKIDQQKADQAAQQIQGEIEFHKKYLENQNLNTQSEVAARNQQTAASRWAIQYVPGIGNVVRDTTNPFAPPQVVPFNPMAPSGSAAAPASTATQPVAPDPTPAAAPATPAPAPAAPGPATIATGVQGIGSGIRPTGTVGAAPSVPVAAPAAPTPPPSFAWKPTTTVPQGFVPPNQYGIYTNGTLPQEQAVAKGQIEEARNQSAAANTLQMRLDEMDHQFAQLPKNAFLSPGVGAETRAKIASTVNQYATSFGGQPLFDTNEVAAHENLLKDRFRLGADLAKSMGGREPGYIVQQAVKANPGTENTPLGYQRITSGLREMAQYQQDRAAFFDDYNARFGHLNGAQEAFDKLNPPQMYANRAILSTVDPRAIDYLRQNPATKGAFDQKFGAGTSAMVLGQ